MNISELHRTRIANDYKEMCCIQSSPMVSWVATKGVAPYIEEYLLTINVKTYCSPTKTMNQCKVRIVLPPNYPTVAPNAIMEGTMVYHPNWFQNTHRWCCGNYRMSESLGNYVVRMIQTLQFDPVVTFPDDPADKKIASWYKEHMNDKKMFPTDKQPLPNPNPVKVSGFKRIR